MRHQDDTKDTYYTEITKISFVNRLFPSSLFYLKFLQIVFHCAALAKRNKYDNKAWETSSLEVRKNLEKIGLNINFSGINHFQNLKGPCVIVGNHMSMMETLLLPGFLLPFKPITFVVKESLLNYPVFKHVMRSRHPIAVTRTNPRQDLKTVITEGMARLEEGQTIIVFPQTTRTHGFDPKQMSSIGVKLAQKAGVPVLPLALKTDCWQNGRLLKDFGKINTAKKACFALASPLTIKTRGVEEQEKINRFIEEMIATWSSREKSTL